MFVLVQEHTAVGVVTGFVRRLQPDLQSLLTSHLLYLLSHEVYAPSLLSLCAVCPVFVGFSQYSGLSRALDAYYKRLLTF